LKNFPIIFLKIQGGVAKRCHSVIVVPS
jgi:hypothetical protein